MKEPDSPPSDSPSRRDFLKIAGATAGALALTGCPPGAQQQAGIVPVPPPNPNVRGSGNEVIVVGAGLWGSFTAYHLRRKGMRVTLIDQYGPGNSRSTSGDETRGVRSTYGDRSAGELWMLWARDSMRRWKEFDAEWSRYWKMDVYVETGDLLLRGDDSDNIARRTREWWDKHKVPYDILSVDEVRRRWPVIDVSEIGFCMLEQGAGVLRSRRAAQYAAAALEKMGGKVATGRVIKMMTNRGRLEEIELDTGARFRADLFVFALGPWMRTFFPDVLGDRMNTPLAQVCYFATPAGDQRFTAPNLPSWNFSGVTGWPALPVDNRGFRVRGGMGAPRPAPAPGDSTAAAAGTGRGGGAAGDSTGRGGRRGGAPPDTSGARGRRGGAPPDTTAGRGRRGGVPLVVDSTGRGRGAAGDSTGRGGGRGTGRGGGGGGGATPLTDAERLAREAQQDPDRSDRSANLSGIESSRRFVARRFPLLANAPISETRACHYEGSINRDFIIDWHPEMANVMLAGAGNSEGAKFATIIGEYVSERVIGNLGDPETAKRFVIPKDTYTSVAQEQAARQDSIAAVRRDSLARRDSTRVRPDTTEK